MASSLAEDLVCPICLGLFQEPHMLSCGHNFCLACLKSCVPDEGPPEGTCPECRQPFELGALASNRALGSLARKARRLKLDQEPLCGDAAAFVDHFCEDHDEALKLFCKQDRLPICVICRDLPEHRGHDFLPTKNAVDYAQKKMKPYLKSLKKKLKDHMDNESYQLQEIEILEICTNDTLSYIASEFEALHQILREKEEDIKKQVHEMKEENLEEMQEALTSLKDDISLHTELIAGIETALATTDRVSFLKDFKNLMGKVKECQLMSEEDDSSNVTDEEEDTTDEESGLLDKPPRDQKGEKSPQAKPGANKGPMIILEEQEDDSEDEVCEEEEDEEDDDNDDDLDDDRVVSVEPKIETFTTSLDFEAWKEVLKSIKPN